WAILAVVVVVLIAGGAALTSGLRRRRPPRIPGDRPVGGSPADVRRADELPPETAGSAVQTEDPVVVEEPPVREEPVTERPAPVAGRMVRLRERLSRSGTIGRSLLSILSRESLTEEDWEEIEETLLLADVGIGPTTELMDRLRTRVQVLGTKDAASVRDILREELLELVDPTMDRSLRTAKGVGDDGEPHPATVLVVGVNGTGKTTTVGKLARVLVAEDLAVVLGAA